MHVWLKNWTADRSIQGSSPTYSIDLFLSWVLSMKADKQWLSRDITDACIMFLGWYDFKCIAWPDMITEAMINLVKMSWIFNPVYLSTEGVANAQQRTRETAKSSRICMYTYNIMFDACYIRKAVLFLCKFPKHPYTWGLDTAMNRSETVKSLLQ